AAIERATALALEICGGRPGPLCHAQGELPSRPSITVRPDRVRRLLGYPIDDAEMHGILARLSCVPESAAAGISATPPSWRFDLSIEEDLVEEIARIHGYEHVPAAAPRASAPMLPLHEGDRSRFDLRHRLAALGYQEVINYSFVPEEWETDFAGRPAPVRLANPIASPMSAMRTTLLGGLVHTLRSNLNRGEGRVRIFEIGRCFLGADADMAVQPERIAGLACGSRWPEQWAEKAAPVDFFDAKGDVEALAGRPGLAFSPGSHPASHPGRCATISWQGSEIGTVGELHPRLQQRHELASAAVFFEVLAAPLLAGAIPAFEGVSRVPAVRRDLAFSVAESVAAGAILGAIRATVPTLVREAEVFDQYRGKGVEPGQKSLALRIVMQDTDRTLTDSEVEEVVTSIWGLLREQFKAKPRT
ncbi:MAG: phenylalanine--tRNA ligase subunit beta, partial [Usitatibacter sp.]